MLGGGAVLGWQCSDARVHALKESTGLQETVLRHKVLRLPDGREDLLMRQRSRT